MATLDSTQPFRIILPDDAAVQAGEVVLSLADIRQGVFGPVEVDVDADGALRAVRWVPGFAGRLTYASAVLSGATTAVGPATAAIAVAGSAVTLDAAISFPAASAAGTAQNRTVTAGGAFTASQEVRITPGGTNTAASFIGVVLGYERT